MSIQLTWKTPVEWVQRVAERPLQLLEDHAHCELKAAASAQTLIAKRPRSRELVEALGEVAAEEIEHFNRVLKLFFERGGTFGPAQPSPYAEGLVKGWSSRNGEALLDRLIVSGLIEARSLERFVLLSRHLPDPELRDFYAELVPSEAGHRALFFQLASQLFPEDRVRERVAEFVELESRVVSRLTFAHRMHSGVLEPADSDSDSALASSIAVPKS